MYCADMTRRSVSMLLITMVWMGFSGFPNASNEGAPGRQARKPVAAMAEMIPDKYQTQFGS